MKGDSEAAVRYRRRAEEVRIIAEDTQDSRSRAILLTIADDYERMARQMDDSAEIDRQVNALHDRGLSAT